MISLFPFYRPGSQAHLNVGFNGLKPAQTSADYRAKGALLCLLLRARPSILGPAVLSGGRLDHIVSYLTRSVPPGGVELRPNTEPFTVCPYRSDGSSWNAFRVSSSEPLYLGSCGRSWLFIYCATSHAS